MEGNTVLLEDATEQNVQFVRLVIQIEKNQKKPAAKPEPVDRNFQTRSAYGKKQQPRKSIMGSQISREPDITNEM